jgi:septal ring factor EnvC (AmiA/AmiB activator)
MAAVPFRQDTVVPIEPVAAPAMQRASMCGRNVTKCGAHLIFGVGYAVSGFGFVYSVSHSQSVLGGVCALAVVVQVVAHRWWSKFSNLSDAAHDVQGAAFNVNRAALEVHNVTQMGITLAGRVSAAATSVEQSTDDIIEALDTVPIDGLEQNAIELRESVNDIAASSENMGAGLEDIRKALFPLLGIVGSFKSSLKEIQRGFVNAKPYIQVFEELSARFTAFQSHLSEDLCHTKHSFQQLLNVLEEESMLTLRVLQEQGRHVNDMLLEKNKQLSESLATLEQMTQRSEGFEIGMREMQHQLEIQRRENEQLQEKLDQILDYLRQERLHRQAQMQVEISEAEKGAERFKKEWDDLAVLLAKIEGTAFEENEQLRAESEL